MMMDPPVEDVDILVCSFGVISKLTTVRIYNLQFVKFVALDEADALLDVTFEDKLKVFLSRLMVKKKRLIPYIFINEYAIKMLVLIRADWLPSRIIRGYVAE